MFLESDYLERVVKCPSVFLPSPIHIWKEFLYVYDTYDNTYQMIKVRKVLLVLKIYMIR